jgi:hypothetical protein
MKDIDLLTSFHNPGAEFRGVPFWAWNARIEPEELRRQIGVMKDMGLGGFFIHARVGLQTPYLGGKWFQGMKTCIDEASRLGLKVWLYDEDRWPSGSAGGLATADPRYRRLQLKARVIGATPPGAISPGNTKNSNNIIPFPSTVPGEELVALWALRFGDTDEDGLPLGAVSGQRLVLPGDGFQGSAKAPVPASPGIMLAPGETLVAFLACRDEPSDWFNRTAYLDVLNAEAVKVFIDTTHRVYADRVGHYFDPAPALGSDPGDPARPVPGIFTDEPHFGDSLPNPRDLRLPWTGTIPALFASRAGYSLEDVLPALFWPFEDDRCLQTRWIFRELLTSLFVDHFFTQIADFCGQSGLALTGHVLNESGLASQAAAVGSCMRCYEPMQLPGMDLLTDRFREWDSAKQVVSVARQTGRRKRITETYGCTGWDFPFRGHKAQGDWQAVLGINLRCQHLFWYSMAGEAKRDYPASISMHSPWWTRYKMVEDYYARINAALTDGEEIRDILVIHPVESLWLLVEAGWQKNWSGSPKVEALEQAFRELRDTLLGAHLDFDYGDEDMLCRLGRVDPAMDFTDPVLVLGQARYRAVVVPRVLTLRSGTIDLMLSFAEAGGTVVFLDPVPELVDALPDPNRLGALAGGGAHVDHPAGLLPLLEPYRTVSIQNRIDQAAQVSQDVQSSQDAREEASVLYQLRRLAGGYLLFLADMGCALPAGSGADLPVAQRIRDPGPLEVRLCGSSAVPPTGGQHGAPMEFDLETGKVRPLRCRNGAVLIQPGALGTRLLWFPDAGGVPIMPEAPLRPDADLRACRLEPAGSLLLQEPNVLVLDRVEAFLNGSSLGTMDVLKADRKLRDTLGLPRRGGSMVQPWIQEEARQAMDLGATTGTDARTRLRALVAASSTTPGSTQAARVRLVYRFILDWIPPQGLTLTLENADCWSIGLNSRSPAGSPAPGYWVDPAIGLVSLESGFLRTGQNELSLEGVFGSKLPELEACFLLGDFDIRPKERIPPEREVFAISRPERNPEPGDLSCRGLPFFSGSVSYRYRLEKCLAWDLLKQAAEVSSGTIVLRTGPFDGTCAAVWLDGHDLGTIAWEPWELDIGSALESALVEGLAGCAHEGSREGSREGCETTDLELRVELFGSRRNSFGPLHHRDLRPLWVGPECFLADGDDWRDDYQLVPYGLRSAPVLVLREASR